MSDTVEGNRWATVTPDDRSGILYIVAFLTFTYSNLTFLTRLFIKWHVMGLDDAAMSVSQVASVIQFALLVVSISAGLGKTYDLLPNEQYTRMASTQYGTQIALYISVGFSKIATILLIQRLFTRDMKKEWMTCNIVTGCCIVWTALTIFLVSIGCSPESMAPQTARQTCSTIIARYKTIVITDALTDLVLVVLPLYLCWRLQMSIFVKLQVLAVFSFRLPTIPLSALFLSRWIESVSAQNPGVARSPAVVFQQLALCVSLIGGTVPCLKSFIRSFDTGSGVKAGFGSSNEYGSGAQGSGQQSHHGSSRALTGSESYKLSSMNRSRIGTPASRSRTTTYDDEEDDGEIRVSSRLFASGRIGLRPGARETSAGTGNKRQHRREFEADRTSQGSGEAFFIRKDTVYEVGSAKRRSSDTPGRLKLPH